VPESLPKGKPPSLGQLVRGYVRILSDPTFQRHALVSAGPVAGIFAFLAGGPVFIVTERGVPASVFGLFPPLATTGFLIFNRLANKRLEVLGIHRVMLLGLGLALSGATSVLALRWTGTLEIFGLTFCMWLFSGGMGIVVPLSTAAAMQSYADTAGSASAVIGFEQMLGGIIGATGVAVLSLYVGSLAFPLVMTGAAATACLSFVLMRQTSVD
jgi:DHA1 family bicyclomycin/chloramphenicol resistance-like MFS transporter